VIFRKKKKQKKSPSEELEVTKTTPSTESIKTPSSSRSSGYPHQTFAASKGFPPHPPPPRTPNQQPRCRSTTPSPPALHITIPSRQYLQSVRLSLKRTCVPGLRLFFVCSLQLQHPSNTPQLRPARSAEHPCSTRQRSAAQSSPNCHCLCLACRHRCENPSHAQTTNINESSTSAYSTVCTFSLSGPTVTQHCVF
jgi:hypothetical protein